MSTLIPNTPPERTPRSEIKVREALSRIDDIVVLHSVAWQGIRRGRQADGEADFIILAPAKGIVILEVKGGRIEVQNGQWYSTDREDIQHRIKNPFDQAKDSKYALIAYLKEVDPKLATVPIVHGVVLPDIDFTNSLGMNAPRQILIDRGDLANINEKLEGIFEHWAAAGSATHQQIQQIADLLAPSVTLAPSLRFALEEANKGIIELTQQQIDTLNGLRRHRRAIVLGGAGTGKTVLAIDKACRLAEEGHRVGLICFNSLLQSEITKLVPNKKVEIHTFHGLVHEWMRKAKLPMPRVYDDAWFQRFAASSLQEAAAASKNRFDALLIDEAQDFSPEWLTACEAIVTPDGILYSFADVRQDLYKRSWEPGPLAISFELSINCRNTRQIARLVASIFNEEIQNRGVDGPKPILLSATRLSEVVSLCQRISDDLLTRERLDTKQLAVLSDSREIVRQLRESMVADLPFCITGETGIVAETIHRFKGLEREAVIVGLSPSLQAAEALELLYVGFSRARAALWIIAGPATISRLRQAIEISASGRTR